MAVTDIIRCNHIIEDIETGAIEIELDWNGQLYPQVFNNRAEMITLMSGGIIDPTEMSRIFFHWWLSRDPDAGNESLVNEKIFEIDFSDPNPIKVHN